MKKSLFLVIAMLLVSVNADAQFGNLVNKAKNAAQKAVTEKAKETTTVKKQEIQQQAETQVEQKTEAVKEATLKPSAACKAADPAANSTEVKKDYSKSQEYTRAFWEQKLDKRLFPYQPYYKPEYSILYSPDSIFVYHHYRNVIKFIVENWGTRQDPGMNYVIKLDNDQYIYAYDAVLNSYAAAFMADPDCWKGYNAYVRFNVLMEYRRLNRWQPSSNSNDEVETLDGTVKIWETRDANYARLLELRGIMNRMCANTVTFNTIGSAAAGRMNMLKEAKKKNDWEMVAQDYLELELIMEDVNNSEKNPHDESEKWLQSEWAKIKEEGLDMIKKAHFLQAPAAEMPKGVAVPANVQAEANKIGKERFGNDFVKAIFTTNKWEEFKNPKWPYEVRHRSMKVDFIVKNGDVYLVHHWVLKQFCENGKFTNYGAMADMVTPITQKVNYK